MINVLPGSRDLGGLPTAAGRTTRPGAVVRGPAPDALAPEGWAALHRAGLRSRVDLRSPWELPPTPAGDLAVVAAPWEEGLLDDPTFAGWAASGELSCALYYRPFLARWPERATAVLRAVAGAPKGGVLVHCQRGRDRTGLLTLLLLALAGVPDEVIVAQHVEAEAGLRAAGLVTPDDVAMEEALLATAGTTTEAELVALLSELDAAALLGADDISALRDRLVD